MCSIKILSFYVSTFICMTYKPSHKQSGTMWLQRIQRKQPIKRCQEKKSSVFTRGRRDNQGSSQGSTNQTVICSTDRKEALKSTVNHSNSPYHRRGGQVMWEQADVVLLVRFTAVTLQIVSLFTGLSMRLH